MGNIPLIANCFLLMIVSDMNHKQCQCSFTFNGIQFITVNGFKIAERRKYFKTTSLELGGF